MAKNYHGLPASGKSRMHFFSVGYFQNPSCFYNLNNCSFNNNYILSLCIYNFLKPTIIRRNMTMCCWFKIGFWLFQRPRLGIQQIHPHATRLFFFRLASKDYAPALWTKSHTMLTRLLGASNVAHLLWTTNLYSFSWQLATVRWKSWQWLLQGNKSSSW